MGFLSIQKMEIIPFHCLPFSVSFVWLKGNNNDYTFTCNNVYLEFYSNFFILDYWKECTKQNIETTQVSSQIQVQICMLNILTCSSNEIIVTYYTFWGWDPLNTFTNFKNFNRQNDTQVVVSHAYVLCIYLPHYVPLQMWTKISLWK